jgi:hypothetical protein
MAFTIVKNLTEINLTKFNSTSRIKYIVIHYYGSLGTAKAISDYFKAPYRGASAHYCLDEDEIIYQCVEDADIAWHCGTKKEYFHKYCRNSNSIGIEVRPRKIDTTRSSYAEDTDWYFDSVVERRLLEFTQYLMKKYNVSIDNVLRHYDVTHKLCPRPYVGDDTNDFYLRPGNKQWTTFKNRLVRIDGPIALGDILYFKGGPVYYSSNGVNPTHTRKACRCVVTNIYPGKHKYHVAGQAIKDDLYGWVDEEDLTAELPDDFMVRVTDPSLNIRVGPSVTTDIVGTITDMGAYTIVATSNGWGRLKSGVGWINLRYTTKI